MPERRPALRDSKSPRQMPHKGWEDASVQIGLPSSIHGLFTDLVIRILAATEKIPLPLPVPGPLPIAVIEDEANASGANPDSNCRPTEA